MFGQANITVPSGITTISAVIASQDIFLAANIEQFSAVQDQECLNYGLFIGCLTLYRPCPGSVWCGANSRDELRSAVTSACSCDRADSCVVNINGVNIRAEDALITSINSTLLSYYVGSSSTGPVGDSNAVCQDVTGKRHNLHACSLHCVVVELVSLCNSHVHPADYGIRSLCSRNKVSTTYVCCFVITHTHTHKHTHTN